MVGVHEGAEVGEVWQGMDAEPGQQEAGTHKGLQEDALVGEPMLPAGVVGPGRMLSRLIGRCSGGACGSGLARAARRERFPCGQRGRLQAHQQVGAPDQLPSARDAVRVGQPVIGPPKLILGVLEAIRDPRAHPEGVAHRLFDFARQVGHEVPGRLGRQVDGIGGDHEIARGGAQAQAA